MFPCMPSRRHFWRTLQLQWLFLEDVPCFARETCQEEPSKLLGAGDESRHSQRCKISEALSLTARYSQCWELSQALSLKPQAYLIKTYIAYIRQNMQQNLNSWCISKSSGLIVRLAHVAPCSVYSRGDDPSWIQYEALFLLSMKSQEQAFYCSYLLQTHHHFEPALFQW